MFTESMQALEFHGAAGGDGGVAGGNDKCAGAAVGGDYAWVGMLSQRGRFPLFSVLSFGVPCQRCQVERR